MQLKKADLHVHSSYSHDVASVPAFAPRALFEKALGGVEGPAMDFFTLTDHDTMAGWEALWRALPEADRELLIPGVEHTLLDPTLGFTIHVNLFLLDPDQYAEIRARIATVDELLAYCRERGILVQYNHPTWWERHEYRAGLVDVDRVPAIADLFDVLEINAGRSELLNLITVGLARELGKVTTSNSDTHTGRVGLAHNRAPGDTPDVFLRNLWSGRKRVHVSHLTYDGLVRTVQAAIDEVMVPGPADDLDIRLDTGSPRVAAASLRLLQSSLIRRHGVSRVATRLLLKLVARAVVRYRLHHERRLEDILPRTRLGDFLVPSG